MNTIHGFITGLVVSFLIQKLKNPIHKKILLLLTGFIFILQYWYEMIFLTQRYNLASYSVLLLMILALILVVSTYS